MMKHSLYFVLLLLCVTSVSGIGVSPATSDLTSPEQHIITLRVINDGDVDVEVTFDIDDEYGFLELQQEQALIRSQSSEYITAVVNTPQGILPGTYAPAVLIQQQPSTQPGRFVSASPALRHRVDILIPRQGMFIDAYIAATIGDVNRQSAVGVVVRNVGTQTIPSLHAHMNITAPNGTLMHAHVFSPDSLAVGETKRLDTQWIPLNQGEYTASATLLYTDQEIIVQEQLEVGQLQLVLGELQQGVYRQGEILSLSVPAQSNWNRELRNVYASVDVRKDGVLIDSFTTPTVRIPALSEATLQGFWDTAGRDEGIYDITFTSYYGMKSVSREYTVMLGDSQTRDLGWLSYLVLLLVLMYLAYRMVRQRMYR